jgi:beta-glucosidase
MVTHSAEESAALALHNGCDINCGVTYLHLLKALQDGLVTEEEITEAAVRAFTARYLLGLFDGSEFDEIPYEKVECREHLMVAERLTRESVVLLKNDGVLPLAKKDRRSV